ncbi:RNA polymerase II subunit A C-terminal domain phosphatase isoform X1 [Tachysurus vachellii]|uniref:RNA polymerase II subunit A C-terminal domain phosphatase isoform X1 n=1 Tax=Tachysurus vachellii TaxID=175792 RepID=UPI00296A9053|nr:RNA polymerase II subunit A C-terminal domain phosphatase isoform X1 [Tachysurus vachellii]
MEVTEIRLPAAARAVRLREWKVELGAVVKVDSVLALCVLMPTDTEGQQHNNRALTEKKLKSDRAGVVTELCYGLGDVICPGDVIARIEECSHPIVMKGLCAECGQDLTQLQNRNGKQQNISTAMVSMVHSVPELMVSSEQAEQLGREDQKRLHRNRKLVLMVDLDQTLIHTTEQHCQHMSTKVSFITTTIEGIFHFQLGRGEPMLHTRLRPYCKEFLEKISKMYELHVFTFGSRLYAHTIAGFLDPEKKLFSHRILSRDECIDPFSKTGNLRNLFPCGDSMVCIIDDREDVWKFAPNLITVKKYVYFKGTGDINAPPGSREAQREKKSAGNQVSQPVENPNPSGSSADEGKNNVHRKPDKDKKSPHDEMSTAVADVQGESASQRTSPDANRTEKSLSDNICDVKVDDSGDSDGTRQSETGDQDNVTVAGSGDSTKPGSPQNKNDKVLESTESQQTSVDEECCGTEENGEGGLDAGSVCDMDEESLGDNGCSDKKETETESQNSEQSGVTMGEESLDHSMVDEEEEEEDMDQDDHLIYLQEILLRIHNEYYSRYDAYLRGDCSDTPDIRKIIPELKSSSLAGTNIVFSGLYPTNYPMERTRESYHAKALGAKISKSLVLSAKDPDLTTHLIAARAGTEKVRQAQACKHVHVVNPDWLWGCLERWERVEEQLFPLKEDYIKSQRSNSPSAFPDVQESFPAPVIDPVFIQPKGLLPPEVHTYDSVTGKLIRRGPQAPRQSQKSSVMSSGHEVHLNFRDLRFLQQEDIDSSRADDEQPGPIRRKRQPSLSESLPLYTLCKEDLDSMDREVDDILEEESDNDSEGKEKEERVKEDEEDEESSRQSAEAADDHQALNMSVKDTSSTSKEDSSQTGITPRGHKRKLQDTREDDDDKDGDFASQSSKESNEDGSSSEADEMAAALEAELNDFM